MADLYPPTHPYQSGFLDTGDGNRIYYEQLGKPALSLHCGPGSGTADRPTRAWDPQRYRVIRFDQRNCGRSTPHASDPAADMRLNTTQHLIDDVTPPPAEAGVFSLTLLGVATDQPGP
ncbi:hypothetical protein [Kitasatospora sp. McL0602]|uniref:hypothetical protein n=1 Tax=Kitasatospora sp. McL0602 TaxID=3439530 RepID=UPI003F8C51B2